MRAHRIAVRAAGPLLALAAVSVVAGCGGSSSAPTVPAATPTATATATATPSAQPSAPSGRPAQAPTPTPTPSSSSLQPKPDPTTDPRSSPKVTPPAKTAPTAQPSPRPAVAPTREELIARLLRVEDLPGKWQAAQLDADHRIAPARLLPLPAGNLPSDADRRDYVQFSATASSGWVLTEEIASYRPGTAAAAPGEIDAALRRTPNWFIAQDRRVQARSVSTGRAGVVGWHLTVSDAHGAGGADDETDTPTVEQTYLVGAVADQTVIVHLAAVPGAAADSVDQQAVQMWDKAAARVPGTTAPAPQATPKPAGTAPAAGSKAAPAS